MSARPALAYVAASLAALGLLALHAARPAPSPRPARGSVAALTAPARDGALLEDLAILSGLSEARVRAALDPDARGGDAASLDALLAELLGSEDAHSGMWAIETCIDLGPRGAAVAAGVAEGTLAARSRALLVRSWTLPREQAVAELRAALAEPSALALLAALELGRLGEPVPELAALEAAATGADALLAGYARRLAEGRAYADLPEGGL